MPANDGFRANNRDGVANIREIPIEADEQRPIKCVGPNPPRRLAAHYVELMAENKQLGFKPPARRKTIAQRPE